MYTAATVDAIAATFINKEQHKVRLTRTRFPEDNQAKYEDLKI